MSNKEHVVVVGGGQAGSSVVTKLRALGFEGDISLYCSENVLPYQRPPLSKKYLLGELDVERLFLRSAGFYSDQKIQVHLGVEVTAIDRQAKTLTCDGENISYDKLVFSTGSRPLRLPASIGGDLEGVLTVRNLRDVDLMAKEFVQDRHVLIVGGGYIGLEAAAVAATRGLKVTLVEMADRILKRVAAPETSVFFRDLHKQHGVNVLENTGLERLVGEGRVKSAVLSDGSEIDVDFVIVGIGILPETTLAESIGIKLNNGIETDAFGMTSDPSIYAAGDCASFPMDGAHIRLESVQNAIDQAELIAKNIMGAQEHYRPKPWFWSDQFDVKLQIAGLNTGYNRVVTRPGAKANSGSFWYFRGNQLLAVDAMNDARSYMVGKRLIEAGKSPDAALLENPAIDLKSLLK